MEEVKEESSVDKKQQESTRVRLIRKVYGVDPLFCERMSVFSFTERSWKVMI